MAVLTYIEKLIEALISDPRSSTQISSVAGIHNVSIKRFRTKVRQPDHETAQRLAHALGYEIILKKKPIDKR